MLEIMRKFLILLMLLICPFAQAFQDVKKISLQEALEIAVENNLDYQALKMNIGIAENKVKESNRLQNPELSTFFNIGDIGIGNPQMLGVSETIEIAKRDARKKLALANLELTKQNLEYVKFDLKMDVREAYVNLVAAKEILIVLEARRKLLNDLLAIAKKRVEAGEVEEIDVIQTEIALNQLVIQVNSQRANVKSATYAFNKAINSKEKTIKYDAEDENFSDKEDFIALLSPKPLDKLPTFEEISKNSIKNRYDIKIAKQEIDVAEKNLISISRQRIPDINLFGGYGYMTKSMSEKGSYTEGAFAGANIVNLPIFYSFKPEIQNAKMQIEQAELKYHSIENRAINDLNSAYEKFLTAQINLNYYNDKLLKNSNDMIKVAKKNYATGKSTLTTLIVMEQAYRSIVAGYTYALADYYNCWINFLREVNVENFDLKEEVL